MLLVKRIAPESVLPEEAIDLVVDVAKGRVVTE
jgi:hypothetical protein